PGSQGWPTVLFTPGEHPLEELAIHLAALQGIAAGSLLAGLEADPGSLSLAVRQTLVARPQGVRLLMMVDQFEVLFFVCREEQERVRFIDALPSAVGASGSSVRVVVGVRADFYGRC